jgi:hypothetical protein
MEERKRKHRKTLFSVEINLCFVEEKKEKLTTSENQRAALSIHGEVSQLHGT